MPTICELQIELKKLGVKGYSGKKKAELEQMLNKAKNKEEPKKEEPKANSNVKLLKNVEVDKPIPNKAPPLSNNSLESLYKKIRSLEKRLKDNVNPNEKKVAEATLQKYKVAFKYVRTQFLDDIKKMKTDALRKLYRKLSNDFSKTTDEDDKTIIGGKMAEINKLLD
jgi:predicted RND superfamily exporter protein